MKHKRTFGPEPHYPEVLEYRTLPHLTIIAGPCSIESYEQIQKSAEAVADICRAVPHAEVYMRGGVFRAGTYPPPSFGMGWALLKTWKGIARENGLAINVEVLDLRDFERIAEYADAIQVGARQSQGYALLKEVRRFKGPVFLKNGTGMKIDEILGACEYLMDGNCRPHLIIRGSSTFHNHVRWDLSVSLIPAIKALTKVPVIVDPSHGTGRRDLVTPVGRAGMAAGADGILVEMHPKPDESVSDAEQALSLEAGVNLCKDAARIYEDQHVTEDK